MNNKIIDTSTRLNSVEAQRALRILNKPGQAKTATIADLNRFSPDEISKRLHIKPEEVALAAGRLYSEVAQ